MGCELMLVNSHPFLELYYDIIAYTNAIKSKNEW